MLVEELRTAFATLDGNRAVRISFAAGASLEIEKALLIPVEDDGLLKLTDGEREYLVNPGGIAWIEIQLPGTT
ncbi:MAG: hypothetical protein VX726_05865 [Planctomycetota bacterium]|nr:hypothetical protein [Planctomycetota bacterium]MEE2895253.1 hypothetical protein [Planctomycetota bacterium]